MDTNKVDVEINQQPDQATKDDISISTVEEENVKTPEEVILNNKKPIIQKLLKIVSVAICLLTIPYFINTIKKDQSFDNLQRSWITTLFMISLINILNPIRQKLLKFATLLISSLGIPYFIYISIKNNYFNNFWGLILMTLPLVSVFAILVFVVLNLKKINKIDTDLSPIQTEIVNFVGDKIFYYVIMMLIVLCILIKPPTTKVKENTPTPITTEIPSTTKTLLALQKSLKTNSLILDAPTIFDNDWIMGGASRVPLLTKEFYLVNKGYNDDSAVWGNFNSIGEITEGSLKPLKKIIDDFFVSNNFIIDNENTYKLGHYEDYIGYTKDDLKCSVKLRYQMSPFARVYCGIVDQNQLKLRQELSSTINPKKDTNVAFTLIN